MCESVVYLDFCLRVTYWKFGSVFNFFQNWDGTTIFAVKFRKSLWKLFYKQEIIKILKRNTHGKSQEEIRIMMWGLLPCWNMDVIKKWRSALLLVTNNKNCFGASLVFIRRVPPSNLSLWRFLLTSLRKGYFLCRRCKRYPLLIEEIAILMVFDIRLQASSRNSNAESICVWWMGILCSSIMLTFFTETSPLRTSVPLWKHMWATVDQHYAPLSFQFQLALKLFSTSGSVNEILAFTETFVALTFTTHRNASEWNVLHCKERMEISNTIFYSFYGEKELLTECSDVWSSSP